MENTNIAKVEYVSGTEIMKPISGSIESDGSVNAQLKIDSIVIGQQSIMQTEIRHLQGYLFGELIVTLIIIIIFLKRKLY